MDNAPYRADLADGPEDGQAFWVTARDGVRLRLGVFAASAPKGTVLLFPGRTEYIEKYGRAAADFEQRGFATLVIDWRGQGLSERLLSDPMSGHVDNFRDYQTDVAAMLETAEALDLPQPYYMLAHSMGGCIGLRALIDGAPVAAAGFSAPMWGIQMNDMLRVVAWSVSWGSRQMGVDHIYAPTSTSDRPYVLVEPFETNKLTRDGDMYRYMITQAREFPRTNMGGTSLRWLHEALTECHALSGRAPHDIPCTVFAGTDEQIVDLDRIRNRVNTWPGAQLTWFEGARHEVLMEGPDIRREGFDALADHFEQNALGPAPLSRLA